MPAPDVAALLMELERADPAAADAARLAVDWLTGGEPLETVAQLDVCEFLWYTLPLKAGVAEDERVGIARALGRLLRMGGMERYAALCFSTTTSRVLRVYRTHGEDAGLAAYQRALDATGVLPPDVPELAWSSIMGPEELAAHGACSAALELAIVSGELTPGATRQRERLTSRWLLTPRPELGGDNWLQRVHGERLNRWVLGRGGARRALAQPFEVRLHAPVPPPGEAHLQPLRWLLELGVTGVPLTRRHNLARSVVVEAADRFGWAEPGGRAPRAEADVPELVTLHGIARGELGALRRTGGRLTITREGRRLLDDPGAMWDAATNALAAPEHGDGETELAMREVALMILAEGRPLRHGELTARVAEVAAVDERRPLSGPADSPEGTHGTQASRLLTRLRRRLDAFGLRVPTRSGGEEQLTPAGQAAALAALRAHALRPRQSLGPR
jgi:hypothetical protein